MSRTMNLPQIQKIMMEFEKEMDSMDMKEEMMSDAVDNVMEVHRLLPTPWALVYLDAHLSLCFRTKRRPKKKRETRSSSKFWTRLVSRLGNRFVLCPSTLAA